MLHNWIEHLLLLGGITAPPPPPAQPPVVLAAPYVPQSEAEWLEVDPCPAPPASCSKDIRRHFVDLSALGEPGGVWLHYNYTELTRGLSEEELQAESELSLAVRLIISEVGADRLLASQHGLMEAIGILYTVDNRLDPLVYNPDGRDNAPRFPGCGPGGTFAGCSNAQQYLGMATWRALAPQLYAPSLLEPAVDLAVRAWYLQERGLIADPTEGATSYVHRCGGAAYGEPTWRCDAHLGRPRSDIPGADPHTGPILFKAPARWLHRRGHYRYDPISLIDYAPWPDAVVDDHEADDDDAPFSG